jgi:hypothetical protein
MQRSTAQGRASDRQLTIIRYMSIEHAPCLTPHTLTEYSSDP